MANLSETKARSVTQQEQIGRRASIVPERRDTRAPDFRPAADLRSARRGDGGAANLMRTLGMVENAASDFQKYSQNQHAADEQDNIAQGAVDQLSGRVDVEKFEKSAGYQNAVTKGRTTTNFNQGYREFVPEFEAFVDKLDDVRIEDRQGKATEMLEGFFHNFAVDPETGQLKDFMQSPSAMRYLADAIGQTRPRLEAHAKELIEKKFNAEGLSHYSQNFTDQWLATGTIDISAARELLPATVSNEEIAGATIVGVHNAVSALRGGGRFDEATRLLASLRGYMDTPLAPNVGTSTPSGSVPSAATSGSSLPTPAPAETKALFNNPVGGGRVTSQYGANRGTKGHNGVDIAVPVGTPVRSAMGGEVLRVWNSDSGGLSVKVKYDDGTVAGFAHLSATDLQQGARVEAGAELAKSGNTGRSTGPHLHYTLTRNGQKINPTDASPGAVAAPAAPPQPSGAFEEAFPAPEGSAPVHRLTDPFADPITKAETEGVFAPLKGLEGVIFSPEQRAKINEMYTASTTDMRREWRAAKTEAQSQNATRLAMGLFGQGGFTTASDIQRAYREDEIDDEMALSLLRTVDGNMERAQDKAERAVDRAEARAERDENRRDKRMVEGAMGWLTGQLTDGASPAQIRTEVIKALPNLPASIRQEVMSQGLSLANGYETLIQNDSVARDAIQYLDERKENAASEVAGWGIVPSYQANAVKEYNNIVDMTSSDYVRRRINNEPEAAANKAVLDRMEQRLAALRQRLTPKAR